MHHAFVCQGSSLQEGEVAMRRWGTEEILGVLSSLDDETLPEDFVDIRTAAYRLIRYPPRFLSPTLPAAQVVWSRTLTPLDAVFDEIASEVRDWGLDEVHWWVSQATRPLDTEAYLRARGGVLSDSYQILARELDRQPFNVPPGAALHVEVVRDELTLRDAIAVETQGWRRPSPDDGAISERLRETLRHLETSKEFQMVAYVAGQPAATGCCTLAGELGRLYGAVTLPEFRSRGCYHAVLASRLRQASDFGATVAVTRGRPHSSGRILARAGFATLDIENCYRISLA